MLPLLQLTVIKLRREAQIQIDEGFAAKRR